jgi:hypothetical protein
MKLGNNVDPEALRRFREARGLTHEQVAEIVWASPLEVAAWEAGTVRVPAAQARRLRHVDAADRRAAVIAAAALPQCAWANANAPDLHAMLLETPDLHDGFSPAARFHADGCPACLRVREFGRGLLRLKPDPGLGTDLWDAFEYWFDTAPRIVVSTVVLGAGTALFVGLPRLLGSLAVPAGETPWVDGGRAVFCAVVAFAAVATVLRRLTPRWPHLAGMLSAAAAVLAGMLTWIMAAPGEHWLSGPALLVLLVLAAVLGVLAGRWNEQNPWDGEADAGQVQPAGDRLGLPDPLPESRADDAGLVPLRAGPAPDLDGRRGEAGYRH